MNILTVILACLVPIELEPAVTAHALGIHTIHRPLHPPMADKPQPARRARGPPDSRPQRPAWRGDRLQHPTQPTLNPTPSATINQRSPRPLRAKENNLLPPSPEDP
jgi:hypothetical protein